MTFLKVDLVIWSSGWDSSWEVLLPVVAPDVSLLFSCTLWNSRTTRWPITKTPSLRGKKWQGRTKTSQKYMAVCSLSLHLGSSESRQKLEQTFIFQIGTLNPNGINERFSFNQFLFLFLVTICKPTHNPEFLQSLCEGPKLETSAFKFFTVVNLRY